MSKTIEDLRAALFATLEAVRDGTLDLDKARQVNEVAKTLVESAKVEVDYLRVTGGAESAFLDTPDAPDSAPSGISGIVRHRLAR